VTSLTVDIEGGGEGAPEVTPPATDLLAFCSFAFAVRFGAQHELSLAASRLKERYTVDLRPFTTYAEGLVKEQGDSDDLERAWQDAARVAENAEKALAAIRSGDVKLGEWLSEWPGLIDRLEELSARARWAANRGVRIRFAFFL
jgi:hypothetical protein